jgi:hypothetical protein
MHLHPPESYLIRVWAEPEADPEADEPALRGSIQHVASGHKTYFTSLDLPVALLRSAIDHLAGRHQALD